MGISPHGINFHGPDHKPAHVIFLLLTPDTAATQQLEIIADISNTFGLRPLVDAARRGLGYTEFLALARTREAQLTRTAS